MERSKITASATLSGKFNHWRSTNCQWEESEVERNVLLYLEKIHSWVFAKRWILLKLRIRETRNQWWFNLRWIQICSEVWKSNFENQREWGSTYNFRK